MNGQAIQQPVPQQREVNLIKVAKYNSTTNIVFQLEDFEKVTTTNRFLDLQKLAIESIYLKESANTWYQN